MGHHMKANFLSRAIVVLLLAFCCAPLARGEDQWVTYEGKDGPGKGKHIVFVTGDDEYRSEESMPMLAKILADHHGFTCTVLFAINPKTGEIDPSTPNNIPGLEALDHADLMVTLMRFRDLPKEQFQHILDYANSGKPMIGLRTATHSFQFPRSSEFSKWSWNSSTGGFGRMVLGETWISHYGAHERESTRGIIAPGRENDPIVRGVKNIWAESDVYGIKKLSGDSQPLILGQPLAGMHPTDPPVASKPPVPVAWTKTYTGTEGKASRVFTTTMGQSDDFKNEGVRRLVINACYWAMGMEDKIDPSSNVDIVGTFNPTPIGFGKFKRGVKPADFQK